jgi:hypothetical protein
MSRFDDKCVLCGSTRSLEKHHVGGHWFDFKLPLCHAHHATITVGLKRLRIDTSRRANHLLHAIRATLYFLWMLLDALVVGGDNNEGDHHHD